MIVGVVVVVVEVVVVGVGRLEHKGRKKVVRE